MDGRGKLHVRLKFPGENIVPPAWRIPAEISPVATDQHEWKGRKEPQNSLPPFGDHLEEDLRDYGSQWHPQNHVNIFWETSEPSKT